MASGDLSVEIVETTRRFEQLKPAWDELLVRARTASPFMTWEWQFLWWTHYGQGRPLVLLAVWSGDVLRGVLPLYIQQLRLFWFVPVRLLRNVGTGGDTTPDDLDPLVCRECEEPVVRAMVQAIARYQGRWDVLKVSDLRSNSLISESLLECFTGKGWFSRRSNTARVSYIQLPESWEAYLATLSGNRRYIIRSSRRKFEQLPGARYQVCRDASELERDFNSLVDLHRRRWTGRAESHAFSTPAYLAFHLSVMHAFLARGWLHLCRLEVEDRPIAMYYCYCFGSTLYYFQGGFDPDCADLRPGLVLMGYAIENAIGGGLKRYDMLRGEYDFKTQWAKERRETFTVESFRPGIGSLALRTRFEWLPAIKQHAVAMLGNRWPRLAGRAKGNA